MPLFDSRQGDFDTLYRHFRWSVPARFNIAEMVCDRHTNVSERTALFYENEKGETAAYRFGHIKTLSNRLANALKALGVQRGDRVALVLAQRPETAIAHMACYKIGAVALPLSILFGADALQYRLADSGSKVAITDARRLELLAQLQPDLPVLQTIVGCGAGARENEFWQILEKGDARLQRVDTAADDPALLIYTSGTTGPPKGALVAHRTLIGNLPGFELSQNFFPQPQDLFWTPADWAWTGGLWDALLPSWYYGRPILAYEGGKFDPEKACDLMARYRVTNAFIPPTALKMIRQISGLQNRYALKLRAIMSAGEAVGEELIHWARTAWGLTVNEMWGQTEFNYLVGNCAPALPVRPGSMGKPYPGHRVDVIDAGGRVRAAGETGELAARRGDPVMFLGYWNNPEATQNKFCGEWFCTGDVGYRDEQGYLWFVGRKDDVISSAGYRIGPGEIEDCLLKHPAVAQAAVIGKPDALRGSIVKAFVVLSPGYAPDETLRRQIQETVRDRLAAYEYPREIEFIDQLPMTTTGKVRRIELRQREAERMQQKA